MLAKVGLLLVAVVSYLMALEDQSVCFENRTLIDVKGDAVLSVFLDKNRKPYCNVSSLNGLQEISTAQYVIQTLNKYDYVPGISLGLKIFDTCHDEMTAYKQALQAAVDSDCVEHYDLGILVSDVYSNILEPFRNYSILPISTYQDVDLAKPMIAILVHYLSTRFETIDLILTNSESSLKHFLDTSKSAGLCVKSYTSIDELEEDKPEIVIVSIGDEQEIRKWIQKGDKMHSSRRVWIALALDGSNLGDSLPSGSYLVTPEFFNTKVLQKNTTKENNDPLIDFIVHSPHLLNIGKSIIEIAQILQAIQKRSCPQPEAPCILPRFNPSLKEDMKNSEIYDALRLLPMKSYALKYSVVMKNQQELVQVATYKIEAHTSKYKIVPDKKLPKMPKLCLKRYTGNCEDCANFQGISDPNVFQDDHGVFKSSYWIPIFLTLAFCGSVGCISIFIFIVYRQFKEEILDGNPTPTLLLILTNILMLATILPFCLNDKEVEANALNSIKIYLSTSIFGILFSIMLSRSLFLAFSIGGVITSHISGYLQGFMIFFMVGVEMAISTSYLILSTSNPTTVVRSLTFIALLGYDIFLLLSLFGISFFITNIQRNYREGRCFFCTSIGLLIVWAVWITCFILMGPETRDLVVCFGIIFTSYLIIIGIFIPRTYYMVTKISRQKTLSQKFIPSSLIPDSRIHANISQPYISREYTSSGERLGTSPSSYFQTIYPNYYGNSSPNIANYGNHLRNSNLHFATNHKNDNLKPGVEMREMDNSYTIPQVYIDNSEIRNSEKNHGNPGYGKPRCNKKKITLKEKDCIQTDVYVEDRKFAPLRREHNETYPSRCSSPRLGQTEMTINEENENEGSVRITRF